MLASDEFEGAGIDEMAQRPFNIKVIKADSVGHSTFDAERALISCEIRRHEIALLRALRDLHERFPAAAVVVVEELTRKISLTKENG